MDKKTLTAQLQKLGIKVEGNKVKKSDIQKVLASDSISKHSPLLSGIDVQELITTVKSNEKVINANSVRKVYNEILKANLEDAKYLLEHSMQFIIKEATAAVATSETVHEGEYKLEKYGSWLYYFDGSGGELYAKTDAKTLVEFLNSKGYSDGAAPFETAIPEGDELNVYPAGDNYPKDTLNLEELNEELGTDYAEWGDYLTDDES